MSSTPWALAVDVGTTNTVAAVVEPGREPRLLSYAHQGSRLSSAVFLDDAGAGPVPPSDGRPTLSVGERALRQARTDPSRFVAAPKAVLGQSSVRLGDTALEPWQLVSAVLRRVLAEGVRQQGSGPATVALTHPAGWGGPRLGALQRAAADAFAADVVNTSPRIVLLPEPVAAAWSIAEHVPPGRRVAIFDLGGGTVDVATVERRDGQPPAFDVVGEPRGLDGVGGNDLDLAVMRHVLGQLPAAARARLAEPGPDDVPARVAALDLRDNCRKAKEDLSEHPRSQIYVPALPPELAQGTSVPVTQAELERLVVPQLEDATALLREVVRALPGGVDEVLMVGGTSRIPALSRLVHDATGLYPQDRGDPVASVAVGVARWLLPERLPESRTDYRGGHVPAVLVPTVTVPPSGQDPPPVPTPPVPPPPIPPAPTPAAWWKRPAVITPALVLFLLLSVGSAIALVMSRGPEEPGGADTSTSPPPSTPPSDPPSAPPSTQPIDELKATMIANFALLSDRDLWSCEETRDTSPLDLRFSCEYQYEDGFTRYVTVSYHSEDAEQLHRSSLRDEGAVLEYDGTWESGNVEQGTAISTGASADQLASHHLFWDDAPGWDLVAYSDTVEQAQATAYEYAKPLPLLGDLPTFGG